MDALQDPTNQALVTSITDEACARAKLSFSDSAVASAECEEARVKAGKAAWIEIERAAKDGRQPNLVLDDLMPGLPTARAATAPDALAHATVPTSAQAEPNLQQQPQSQPDPSTKQQQESPASAIMNALIAEHETKHHVSTACSSLAVLGHAIALAGC
jgi:hypothetical protein